MLIIGGNLLVDPERVDSFMEELRAVGALAAHAGALFFAVALEKRTDGRVLVLERWPDENALNAFLAQAEVGEFFSTWGPHFRNELLKFDANNHRALEGK